MRRRPARAPRPRREGSMADNGAGRPEKYTSWGAYAKAKARRGVMRAALRGLVSWDGAPAASGGYTVIIGSSHRLAPLVGANLSMLARQDLTGADRVLVVFDKPREEMDPAIERSLRE